MMKAERSMFTLSETRIGHEPVVKRVSALQRVLREIDGWTHRLGRTPKIAPHLATGIRGEEEAFFYLRRRGYTIVARRWRTPKAHGDVDLICWDGDTLCFIEVKTRTGHALVPAEFAVDAQKQKMLRSMASVFHKRLPEETRRQTRVRFDVVSVYLPPAGSSGEVETNLFQAAFAYSASEAHA